LADYPRVIRSGRLREEPSKKYASTMIPDGIVLGIEFEELRSDV
jgi:hypothetical protein